MTQVFLERPGLERKLPDHAHPLAGRESPKLVLVVGIPELLSSRRVSRSVHDGSVFPSAKEVYRAALLEELEKSSLPGRQRPVVLRLLAQNRSPDSYFAGK